MRFIESAVRTNKGKIRENNEDNFYIFDTYAQIAEADEGCKYRKFSNGELQIYAVCDGMGGVDAGEIAAYTVVSELKKITAANITDMKTFPETMKSILDDINIKCREITNSDGHKIVGAGCTISMVCIVKNIAYIVNAGDSRVYLWKKNKLTQLTDDHTYPQLLYKQGEIAKEDIENHPQSHVITQYVGMPEEHKFEPDISKPYKIKKSDILIICSDGLPDMVSDKGISEILSKTSSASDICKLLITSALENGGDDNITVMAVKCIK